MWSKEDDWFWEGNIQKHIAVFLREQGYEVQEANTNSKEQGVDITATKPDSKMLVEVKGWPSDKYVDGAKKGQRKKTNPPTQARQWFAEAISSIISRKNDYEEYILAIGLPDYSTYHGLIKKTEWALRKLEIRVYLVKQSGKIERAL
ncbi:MAG: restriction endonuclease [Chloroflexi bacterium]|nr:restriction endonuclease [Chloroflexota bacterium]MBI5713855.1 restriction endonuclease [Chloroflexota bacterium]